MVLSLSCFLTGVNQIETLVPKTFLVLLVKLWSNLALGIGQLVVLLTLVGSLQGIDECIVHTLGINGLQFLAHLLVDLILGDNRAFSIILLHSQVDKFVVGLSLLGIVGQRSKILLQQLIGFVVGL